MDIYVVISQPPQFALWSTDSYLTSAEQAHPIPRSLKVSTHFSIYSNLKSHLSLISSKVPNFSSESP